MRCVHCSAANLVTVEVSGYHEPAEWRWWCPGCGLVLAPSEVAASPVDRLARTIARQLADELEEVAV